MSISPSSLVLGQIFQGRLAVVVEGDLVVGLEQHLQVVGDIDVVVHYDDVFFVRFVPVFFFHDGLGQGVGGEFRRFAHPFVGGVGLFAHGQGQAEEGASLGPIPRADIPVMQPAEHARIVQADAGARKLLPGLRLVKALEDLLQLVFVDARPAVGHADAGPLGVRIGPGEGEAAQGIGPA